MNIEDEINELQNELPEGCNLALVLVKGQNPYLECGKDLPFQEINGDGILQMIRDGVQACIKQDNDNE